MSTEENYNELLSKVQQNLEVVLERISVAADKSNRSAKDITLVGVTKYVGIPESRSLLQAGCKVLGESRPQQLWQKNSDSELSNASWHLIGHLQRNKVERTLPAVDLIHGVDSLRLLEAINQSAAKQGVTSKILLEVNCSGDEAKHGFHQSVILPLFEDMDRYNNIEIKGLMTMAAREGGSRVARSNFASLRELRDELREKLSNSNLIPILSMGMSGDFEEAILEGSTMVRVGSALWNGIRD